MFGSTSYFSQFSETFCCTTRTYHAYRLPKSPPPPVNPNPPLAPPALKVPYGPLTGPPCPKGTTLFASTCGCGSGFRWVSLTTGLGFGLVFAFLSGIGIASGSLTSGRGSECVRPFDSFASTFSSGAGRAGSGTVLTSVTPSASPPPPAPQLEPPPVASEAAPTIASVSATCRLADHRRLRPHRS